MSLNLISHRAWLENLIAQDIGYRIQKQNGLSSTSQGNHRQDESRPVLESLLTEGYDTVLWDAGNSVHSGCRELHNQQWTLEDFLSGLMHDAPIFEKSHPGDQNCLLVVTGPDLPPITVDSYGNIGNL